MRREERFDNPPCLFLQSLLGWVSASRVVYVSLAARSVSSGCIRVSSLSGTWGSLHLLKVCWSAWKERKMYGTYSEDAIYEQINQKSIHEYVRCVCWWTNNNIQWLCPLSCPWQMQNVWKILNLRAKEPKFLKSFLYLMKFLLASLIAGSLSAMSVWLLRASSGNNSPSSIISSVTASWGLLAL